MLFSFYLKDAKLRQIVTLGLQDTLEEKTVTICHGSDFVNMTFVNFCCTKRDIAQVRKMSRKNRKRKQATRERRGESFW